MMMMMMISIVLLAMAVATSTAFSFFSRPKAGHTKTSVFTKGAAFHQVRAAAERFKTAEGRQQAADIVKKLEITPSEQWLESKQLTLIDSCLVDEEPEACDDFQEAMMDLRSMYEPTAGNA